MRDILFRGKRISAATDKNGEWVFGYYTGEDNLNHYIKDLGKEYHFVDPDTIGQFTGLLDKNGVRIFEGDVVRYNKNNRQITYYNGAWYIDDICCFVYLNCNYGGVEIIGNIHDQPELLKEATE